MIKLEKILEQKLSEIEELYEYDFSAKDHLQRLKKQGEVIWSYERKIELVPDK